MNHDTYSDDDLRDILLRCRRIALVGASPDPDRPSHIVMAYLQDRGCRVFPINPLISGEIILHEPVYPDLSALPEAVEMVDIFRNSAAAGPIVDQVIALDPQRLAAPRVVWMQIGVRDDAAAARAEAAGLKVVMNRCPKIEFRRLLGG